MENKWSAFSRRRFLTTSLGVATTVQLHAARSLGFLPQSAVCKLTPEQEVGPYYVADELLRSNIAEGKAGLPLRLRIVLLEARSCQPLANAAIDIWHCDALGLYSGFTSQNPMGPEGPPPGYDPQHPGNHSGPSEGMGPPPQNHPTDKLTFLRGIQITGPDGGVNFTTIFPGFYMGRTNHVHFKVRLDGHRAGETYAAGHTSHIGQVFFPEDVAAELMLHEPYSRHEIHRTTQAEDDVFGDQEGRLSIASLQPAGLDKKAGLRCELVATVDRAATPAPARRIGGPPPR